MSIIKSYQSKFFGGHLNVEFYSSAQEVAEHLETRKITDGSFDSNPYSDKSFVGASREETYKMLREGYQPVVDAINGKIKANMNGKRFKSFNDVVGFQPIVPNAIMGLPKSMINTRIAPIKTKVIDVYYEMTVAWHIRFKDLIKAGQKMLGAIKELEAQGYRFNLYCTQGYYSQSSGCDMLCLKIKSANQPMDLKRMSFPIAHSAFFRGMGFDWYSKFPKGTYRGGYGHAISYDKTQAQIQDEYRKLFGKNLIYFSAKTIVEKGDKADEYIKEVLTNGK